MSNESIGKCFINIMNFFFIPFYQYPVILLIRVHLKSLSKWIQKAKFVYHCNLETVPYGLFGSRSLTSIFAIGVNDFYAVIRRNCTEENTSNNQDHKNRIEMNQLLYFDCGNVVVVQTLCSTLVAAFQLPSPRQPASTIALSAVYRPHCNTDYAVTNWKNASKPVTKWIIWYRRIFTIVCMREKRFK